jgi:hypothetical protein
VSEQTENNGENDGSRNTRSNHRCEEMSDAEIAQTLAEYGKQFCGALWLDPIDIERTFSLTDDMCSWSIHVTLEEMGDPLHWIRNTFRRYNDYYQKMRNAVSSGTHGVISFLGSLLDLECPSMKYPEIVSLQALNGLWPAETSRLENLGF